MSEEKLQPIGVLPEFIWIEQRIKDINDAIDRYKEAKLAHPIKWYIERQMLINRLKIDYPKCYDTHKGKDYLIFNNNLKVKADE